MGNLTGIYNAELASQAGEGSYSPAPEGIYKVVITNAEVKPTNDGTGTRLSFEMQIANGEHASKKLFENLNIVNKSEKATAIAQRDLGIICQKIGIDPNKLADTQELVMKPFDVVLGIEAQTDANGVAQTYPDGKPKLRNTVKTYKTDGTPVMQQQAQPVQQQSIQQAVQTENTPW